MNRWLNSEKETIKHWHKATAKGTYVAILIDLNLPAKKKELLAISLFKKFNKISSELDDIVSLKETLVLSQAEFKDGKRLNDLVDSVREKIITAPRNINLEMWNYYQSCFYIGYCWIDCAAISRLCISYSMPHMRTNKNVVVDQAKIIYLACSPNFAIESKYKTSTVKTLANQIYENKDWGTMPILADALQDAGYNREEPLAKLRDPQTYWFRGAKIFDEILTL